LDGIYTPQMIVGGAVQFSGARRQVALAQLQRAGARPSWVSLTAQAKAHGRELDVTVDVTPRDALSVPKDRDWRLVVALAQKRARTPVLRGENAGETLEEVAVVRAISDRLLIPTPDRRPLSAKLIKPPELVWADVQVVAFVQSETTREIAAVVTIDPG
jgi:hypothetical protein